MSYPKTLREALLHDLMVVCDPENIKRGLKKPPKCIKNWGIEERWVGNCSVPFKLPKEAINILHCIIHALIVRYNNGTIDWTPTVRDSQDDKPELLFVDEYGWCKNSSSEGGRLLQIFSERMTKMFWKRIRTDYPKKLSDDVVHEKVKERKRRLVINLYVDSFMMTWHADNLRKILLLRRTNKEIKNLLDSEDDMSWVVMFEEPTNTTILLTKMLQSYA